MKYPNNVNLQMYMKETRVQLIKFKIMKSPLCDELLIPSSAQYKDLYSWYIVNCVLNAFLTITAIILDSITIQAIQTELHRC